jgi:hypothetical protein
MSRDQAGCGTRSRYKRGCRCEPCTLANRAYQRAYKQGQTAALVERQPPPRCGCGCGDIVPRTRRYTDGHQPPPGLRIAPRSEREEYAEQLLWRSAQIVGAVHDEGPQAISVAIDEALILPAPAGVDPVQALITVLAAQIDPDQPTSAALAWLDQPPRPPTATHPIREEPAA